MNVIIEETTDVLGSVSPPKEAVTSFHSIFKVPLVNRSVRPGFGAQAMLLVIVPIS